MDLIKEYMEEIKNEIATITPERDEVEIVKKVKEFEENLRAEKAQERETKVNELNVKLACLEELLAREEAKAEEEKMAEEHLDEVEETETANEEVAEENNEVETPNMFNPFNE